MDKEKIIKEITLLSKDIRSVDYLLVNNNKQMLIINNVLFIFDGMNKLLSIESLDGNFYINRQRKFIVFTKTVNLVSENYEKITKIL